MSGDRELRFDANPHGHRGAPLWPFHAVPWAVLVDKGAAIIIDFARS